MRKSFISRFLQKEEEECAEVFADFVASFEDPRAKGKTFVRGNTINPETKGRSTHRPFHRFARVRVRE